jgi:hypothetical protein
MSYSTVLTTRAAIETKMGVSQFNEVEINGEKASHVMTIRHTTIEFDIRDRVRDVRGNLYRILSIDNKGEWGDFLTLYCALIGDETRAAVA